MRNKIICLTLSLAVTFMIYGCGGGGGGTQYGSLIIDSTPSNATILLDEENKGATPATIDNIPVGTHNVKLKKNLYKDWEKSIVINANQTTVISADEAMLQSDDDYPIPIKRR